MDEKKTSSIPEIMDVGDLAGLLRVSKPTVRKLIEAGKIPGYCFGQGKYLISKRKLIETIEKG